MKQCVHLVFIGLTTLLLALVVRSFAFNFYFFPAIHTEKEHKKAEITAVKRWNNIPYKQGDAVVFMYNQLLVGKIIGLPGQVVRIQEKGFRLPTHSKCFCHHCAHKGYYLVRVLDKDLIICHCDIEGRAYKLISIDL